jgi:hypothetical protein
MKLMIFEAQVKMIVWVLYIVYCLFYASLELTWIYFLYRIVYIKGYSLEMLRDLEQTPLQTDHAANGPFMNHCINCFS